MLSSAMVCGLEPAAQASLRRLSKQTEGPFRLYCMPTIVDFASFEEAKEK